MMPAHLEELGPRDELVEDVEAFDVWLDTQRTLEVVPDDAGEGQRYRIRDRAHADWALGKIRDARASIAANEEFVRERLLELQVWVEEANRPYARREEFFTGLVREWGAAQVLAEFAEVKDWSKVTRTLSLPNGKVRASRSEHGTFVTPAADATRAAAALLSEIERDDLCTWTPKLTATQLEQAVADGIARLDDDHTYAVKVSEATRVAAPVPLPEWVRLEGVRRDHVGEISFKVEPS